MQYTDIEQKSLAELNELIAAKRQELRDLRFKASEGQLKAVRDIRKRKKEIAQMLTARNAKQRAAANTNA